MPIYEYRCNACGHHLDALQKMTDGPLRKCPDCGKSQLKRLVSAPQFRLKGSGWYETDFKNKDETKRNLVDKAGAESSGSEAKSDAAPKDAAVKPEAAKETAAAKTDGGGEKAAKPQPTTTKKPPARSKSASKSRATKSARR